MSDETKAGILCGLWLIAFLSGLKQGDGSGFAVIILSTAIAMTIIYADLLIENSKAKRRDMRRRTMIYRNYYKEMAEIERERKNDNRKSI